MFRQIKEKISAFCPRSRGTRGLALLSVIILISSLFCFSVSAKGQSIDISKPLSMSVGLPPRINTTFETRYVSTFTPAPNAIWYKINSSNSVSPWTEIVFSSGASIQQGDVYTLSYDFYFPEGFNAASTVYFPGVNQSLFSATGSWINVQGERFFHCSGQVTATAEFSTSRLVSKQNYLYLVLIFLLWLVCPKLS